jgi:hypothetical protein
MSGITVRATTVGAGVLGVSVSRELPFTGHVLTVFVIGAVGLVLSGLLVRFLAARGE